MYANARLSFPIATCQIILDGLRSRRLLLFTS